MVLLRLVLDVLFLIYLGKNMRHLIMILIKESLFIYIFKTKKNTSVYTRVSSFLNWINTDNPQITSPPTKTTVKQSTTTAAPATTTINPIIESTTQAPSSFVERSWQFLLNFRIIKRTSFNGMPSRY